MATYYLNRTGNELQVTINLDPEYERIPDHAELVEAFGAIVGFTSPSVMSNDEIRAALDEAICGFNITKEV